MLCRISLGLKRGAKLHSRVWTPEIFPSLEWSNMSKKVFFFFVNHTFNTKIYIKTWITEDFRTFAKGQMLLISLKNEDTVR